MFSFEHSSYFLALIFVVLLALLFYSTLQWKRKVRKKIGDEALINQLTKNYVPENYFAKHILLISALVLLIFSVANLRKPDSAKTENKAGIDVMIALDVSKSMWSEDVKPSRLEKAKQFINMLIQQMGDNRIGLVFFAGRAYLQMPLTNDDAATKMFIANASPDAVPIQGTQIGDALQLCANSLNTQEKKYKAVILISDGEDHDPKSVNVLQHLNDEGVVVHTVGVGTPEGAPIIEPETNNFKKDMKGNTVITKINEEELKKIAEQTGGTYQNLSNASATVNNITQLLDNMQKKGLQTTGSAKQYTSLYYLFLAAAVIILIVEIFIPEVKKTNI